MTSYYSACWPRRLWWGIHLPYFFIWIIVLYLEKMHLCITSILVINCGQTTPKHSDLKWQFFFSFVTIVLGWAQLSCSSAHLAGVTCWCHSCWLAGLLRRWDGWASFSACGPQVSPRDRSKWPHQQGSRMSHVAAPGFLEYKAVVARSS